MIVWSIALWLGRRLLKVLILVVISLTRYNTLLVLIKVQNFMSESKIIQFKGLIFRHEVDFSLMGLTHYLS